MAVPAHRRLGYSDLLGVARPGAELIDGEIVYKAAPRASHSRTQRRLAVVLDPFDPGSGGGWWLCVEPDVRLGPHDVVRPDLAGWRRERLPVLPDGPVDLAPDWVCEVISPGHENHDRITKMTLYARYGVPWAWLVHPEERRLEVHEARDGSWWLWGAFTDGAVEPLAPFDAIDIDVGSLFLPRDDLPKAVSDVQVAYRAGRS